MTTATGLVVHPVTRERWPDMVDLFSRRGPRGGHRNTPAYGCWCMYWRDRSLEHGEPKKRAMAALVRDGREPGLIAYDGATPVGWISVAARDELPVLLRSPQYRPRDDDEDEDVWSIVCLVVDRNARGQGIAKALVGAAVDHAFSRGASSVESYPHVSSRDDYMGSVALFEGAGFARVRDANKRAVYRRSRA